MSKEKLEIGNWYIVNKKIYFDGDGSGEATNHLLLRYTGSEYESNYGISFLGNWITNGTLMQEDLHKGNSRLATKTEVYNALVTEAIKRGYTKDNFTCIAFPHLSVKLNCDNFIMDEFVDDCSALYMGRNGNANCIFKNGYWAEIIPEKFQELPTPDEQLQNIEIINQYMLIKGSENDVQEIAFVLCKIEGSKTPYQIVSIGDEDKYFSGGKFDISRCEFAIELPNHDGTERDIDGQTYLLTLKK